MTGILDRIDLADDDILLSPFLLVFFLHPLHIIKQHTQLGAALDSLVITACRMALCII